jgi:hypothetical protein
MSVAILSSLAASSRAIRTACAAGLVATTVAASSGCAPRPTAPQLVAPPQPQADATEAADPSGASAAPAPTRDYAAILAAIAERFERELSLPRVDVTLRLYSSRQRFQQGLLDSGYTRAAARRAAASFHAIGGASTVMVNEAELARYPWDQKVRLLAHELAHSVQYRLAGGRRGNSEQWLREGFADYVSCRITSRMGFGGFSRQRDVVLAPIADVPVGSRHVPLGELRTFAQWTAAQPRFDVPIYAQSYVATEMLIEDKGFEALRRYFELSLPSTDADANFREAFGLRPGQFEAAFAQRWVRLLVERGRRES